MEHNEIVDLLKTASAYDNRRPDPASVLAWGEAARRAHWTFPGALDAIHHHYAHSEDRIMPGHVTAHLRSVPLRAYERSVDSALALSPRPASDERRGAIVSELRARLGGAK